MSMTEVEIVRLQNEVAALKARVDTLEKALLRGRRPVARSFAQRLGDPVADVKLHETHGTCDAERLDEQYGRLTCRFVKGHTGDHETKTGAQWGGPMSSATVSEPDAPRAVVEGREFTKDTIGTDTLRQSPRGFDAELEKHRQVIEGFLHVGGALGRAMEAIWFLLALAHQPVPGGVVEVGGSSPAHQYEEINGSTGQATRIAFKGWSPERRKNYIEGLIDEHAYALGVEGTTVMGSFDGKRSISECWDQGKQHRVKEMKDK